VNRAREPFVQSAPRHNQTRSPTFTRQLAPPSATRPAPSRLRVNQIPNDAARSSPSKQSHAKPRSQNHFAASRPVIGTSMASSVPRSSRLAPSISSPTIVPSAAKSALPRRPLAGLAARPFKRDHDRLPVIARSEATRQSSCGAWRGLSTGLLRSARNDGETNYADQASAASSRLLARERRSSRSVELRLRNRVPHLARTVEPGGDGILDVGERVGPSRTEPASPLPPVAENIYCHRFSRADPAAMQPPRPIANIPPTTRPMAHGQPLRAAAR
jgi:hypothetical protein